MTLPGESDPMMSVERTVVTKTVVTERFVPRVGATADELEAVIYKLQAIRRAIETTST